MSGENIVSGRNFREVMSHNDIEEMFSIHHEQFNAHNLPRIIHRGKIHPPRQTNWMTRMISRDYHIRYHSAYYIVYHRFLPKTYQTFFD
jgi:hypothetical protein